MGNTATVNTVGGGSGSGLEPRSLADIESHKESYRRGAIGGEHGAEYLERTIGHIQTVIKLRSEVFLIALN